MHEKWKKLFTKIFPENSYVDKNDIYKNVLEHKHKQVRQGKSQVNYIVTFRDRILRTFHYRFWSSHSCS